MMYLLVFICGMLIVNYLYLMLISERLKDISEKLDGARGET